MLFSLRCRRSLLVSLLALISSAMLHAQSFPIYGAKSGWKNADGSSRVALEFSGGGTPTAGASRKSQTHGWTYRMGGGYNFNRRIALLAEYTYNHFDVPQPLVNEIFDLSGLSTPDTAGDVHLWSTTLVPTYQYFRRNSFGAYILGGGGFYRKLTIFRGTCSGNTCLPLPDRDRYSNNAGGVDGGLGISKRLDEGSGLRLFAEARYVWVDNQVNSAPARTAYFPLTAGLRW